VKAIVAVLLTAVLVTCPFLCQAGLVACCADHCEDASVPNDAPHDAPASEREAVGCICAGATKQDADESETRTVGQTAGPVFLSTHSLDLAPSTRAALSGSLPWSLAQHGPRRVHLLLLAFRC